MLTSEIVRRITELAIQINNRKEHEYAAATFRDVPDLKEMEKLLDENVNQEDEEDVNKAYVAYGFLADKYTSLTRFSIAARLREKTLKAGLHFYEMTGEVFPELDKTYDDLLRDRNFFVDDDCLDVLELMKHQEAIPMDYVQKRYDKRMAKRRTMNNDPVEMSPEYLEVIDEIEERISKEATLKGMGACFEEWDLKQQYLAEKGITWTPPNLLNRNIMFD